MVHCTHAQRTGSRITHTCCYLASFMKPDVLIVTDVTRLLKVVFRSISQMHVSRSGYGMHVHQSSRRPRHPPIGANSSLWETLSRARSTCLYSRQSAIRSFDSLLGTGHRVCACKRARARDGCRCKTGRSQVDASIRGWWVRDSGRQASEIRNCENATGNDSMSHFSPVSSKVHAAMSPCHATRCPCPSSPPSRSPLRC